MDTTYQTSEPRDSTAGLSADALLFVLAVGAYLLLRLLAVDQYLLLRTLYGSFLVVVLMLYIVADALRGRWPRPIFLVKIVLIYTTALILLFGLTAERARLRWGNGIQNTNDGLIQTEEAARMLLAGRNPYYETYFGTALEEAPEDPEYPNPAFYHYAYLPVTFLIQVPFVWLFDHWGWRYDGRWLYVVLLILSLPLTSAFARRTDRRLGLLIALSLNLPLLLYTADGRNDILSYFWLFLSMALLWNGYPVGSMAAMGIACACKQTTWFVLPFYTLQFLPAGKFSGRVVRQWIGRLWPLYATAGVLLVPFILWSPRAFYEDTVLYLTGQLPTSYPMWGIGVGLMLRAMRLVHSQTDYVPLWIPQLTLGGATLVWLVVRQVRHNTMRNVWLGFAVLQLVMGYFSRIFQDNYLAMILILLAFAYFSDAERHGSQPWSEIVVVEGAGG